MKPAVSILALLVANAAAAEDTRELAAHEHGVGALNIAAEGNTVSMEFQAPGADIVGFEYMAKSEEDRAAVDAAVAALAAPLDLFVLPAAAGCTVVQAAAELETEEDHEDHGDHDDHADEHDHDHAEEEHAEEEHADGEHGHDDHDEHGHDDHGHDDHDDHEEHADGAEHSEFHAEYTLNCANPEALSEINFAYFDKFENALELEVQIVTTSAAQAFEVTRDAPILDLRSMF